MMMVTTETEMERMALAFIAGVNEYLMKPFDKCQSIEKVQSELIPIIKVFCNRSCPQNLWDNHRSGSSPGLLVSFRSRLVTGGICSFR